MPTPRKPIQPREPERGESDRPTVVPAFDVEEMARRSRTSGPASEVEIPVDVDDDAPTVIPPGGSHEATSPREKMDTLVDAAELEVARVKSMRESSLPPGAAPPVARWSMAPGPRERPGEGPVIEIIQGNTSAGAPADPLDEARMLLDVGDEAAALAIVDAMLRRTPSNAPARQIAEECERALTAKYTTRLGSLGRVPRLAVSVDKLVSLALDHRAGFLISFVDGMSNITTILDMSGMPASEVLGTLVDLAERGIITLR